MIEKPDTFRALIGALGGVNSFAQMLGVGVFAAKKMRDRSSVGVDHWPRLIAVAKQHGYLFTTDDFVQMAAKRIPDKPRKKVAA